MILAYYPGSGELLVKWVLELCCEVSVSVYPELGQVMLYDGLPLTAVYPSNSPIVYLVRHGNEVLKTRYSIVRRRDTKLRTPLQNEVWLNAYNETAGWSEHVLDWWDKADAILRHEDMLEDFTHVVNTFAPFISGLTLKHPGCLPKLTTRRKSTNKPPGFNYDTREILNHFSVFEIRPSIAYQTRFIQAHHIALKKAGYIEGNDNLSPSMP